MPPVRGFVNLNDNIMLINLWLFVLLEGRESSPGTTTIVNESEDVLNVTSFSSQVQSTVSVYELEAISCHYHLLSYYQLTI